MIAQLTTSGEIEGNFYVQIFENGVGADQLFFSFNIGDACVAPDDDCLYPEDVYGNDYVDCDGNCLNDADGDGVCDEEEVPGCTDDTALNYDPAATDDDGMCAYPASSVFDIIASSEAHTILEDLIVLAELDSTLTYDGAWTVFAPTDAAVGALPSFVVDALLADPATLAAVLTYHVAADSVTSDMLSDNMMIEMINGAEATITFSGSSIFIDDAEIIIADLIAENGVVHVIDAVIVPSIPGCTDLVSCNYNPLADSDDGSCEYESCVGCLNETACNYDSTATISDVLSCTYPEDLYGADYYDCLGNCINDADGDGICDEAEVDGCTDETANNYNPAATDDDGSCDYACGPEWGEPTTYPSVATVLALISVDGENADMEDAVAAYVGDELRGTGDIIDFDGATYVNMTVYLAGGEEMVDFLFFNQDECTTCTMDAGLTAMSFGEYGSFDDPLMFDANCSATTLEVSAMEGWNYVSTNVMPENYAISSLFEDALGGDLLKVLGDDDFALGGSYTPGIPSVFNSLQTHSDAAGYVIKLNADGLWASSGEPLDAASTPLDLHEGWNIIGYVPQVAMSVEDALATIDGVVGTVIDGQNGTVWNPANPNEFNSLLDMEPGRSYWVRMLESATLTYPEAAPEDGPGMAIAGLRSDDAAQQMTGWTVVRSPFAAAVAAEILLDEQPVEGEAYIGAFVGETCVAARPVVGHAGSTATQMAILLEEPAEVTFRLWVEGTVYASGDLLDLNGGEELGQAGQTLPVLRFGSTANAVVETDLLASFSLAPMPARDMTWMDLDVLMDGQVRISVLDTRGAEIAVLHEGQLTAGQHRMPIAVGHWAAGTYFVKGTGPNGVFRGPLIVH